MGGMQVLQWGVSYPDFMDSLVALVPLARTPAWTVTVLEATRKAIMLDPAWKGGDYAEPPEQGIRLWRDILNFLAARSPEVSRDQFPNQLDILPFLQAQETALIKAFADAGLPPGVLGLVYGTPAEISSYLIPHPVIRKVTFTGSIAVGKQLAALAGQHMKRVTMELGGHAPVIVCEDADIALAVKAAGAAKFRNAGQVCISPTRFLVHRSIVGDFAEALADHAKALRVGDGLAEGTQMGPLANPRRIDAMTTFTEDAVQKGAKLLTGGQRIGNAGYFWQPTILADVPKEAKVFNDEPFGPVAAIQPFDTLEQAIAESNRLLMGLAGYAFTKSLKYSDLLARKLEVGMLWMNMPAMPSAEMPFGGVKDSGYGSEGGPEALEAYLNSRAVMIQNA